MVSSHIKLLPAILFIVMATACTTSTKVLKSEVSVDNNSLFVEAAPPAQQSKEINSETPFTINVAANVTATATENVAVAPQDYARSISRLTPLAEKGQANAQYSLGYMYYNGLGVPRNDTVALKWLVSAAQQGNKNAIEALRRIALAGSAEAQKNQTEEVFEQAPTFKIVGRDESPLKEPQVTFTSRLPVAATDAMASKLSIQPKPSLTKNEQWIMDQSGERYTIQLVATANKAAMLRFIDRNNLRGNAIYYKTQRKNNDWYTLILGSFESLSVAKKTVSRLSASLRKTKPWVKPISGIQKALAIR